MRWPWQPKRDGREAEQAKRAAQEHLVRIQSQWPEVRRVSASLRAQRERNHFGEAIERIMRGGAA